MRRFQWFAIFSVAFLLLFIIAAGSASPARAPKRVRTIQNGTENGIDIPDVGSTVDDTTGAVSFGATIRNLEKSKVAVDTKVMVRALDSQGNVLSSTGMEADAIPRNSMRVVGSTFTVDPDAAADVDSVDVTVHVDRFEDQKKKLPRFSADSVNITEDGGNITRATGEIINPFDEDLDLVTVISVFFDADGDIVGGSQSLVESIPAKGKANFDCIVPTKLSADSVKIFVSSASPEDLLQNGP